jgi:hypothetical protein
MQLVYRYVVVVSAVVVARESCSCVTWWGSAR